MKSVHGLAAWLLKGGLMGPIFFDDLVRCGVVHKAAGFKFRRDFCSQAHRNQNTHNVVKTNFGYNNCIHRQRKVQIL